MKKLLCMLVLVPALAQAAPQPTVSSPGYGQPIYRVGDDAAITWCVDAPADVYAFSFVSPQQNTVEARWDHGLVASRETPGCGSFAHYVRTGTYRTYLCAVEPGEPCGDGGAVWAGTTIVLPA